jgi:hypothetical protein
MRIGPNIRALLVLCSIWRVAELISTSDITNLIRSFLGEKKWAAAMLFTCLRVAGKKRNSRLIGNGLIHN